MGWIRDNGLDTLCMAGTYHSGWFVHPHNSRHRAFMTEGSVCYFHPREALYRGTRLRPVVSQVSAETDWFAEASYESPGDPAQHGLGAVRRLRFGPLRLSA